jgi:tRNA threonylcarbamoyl adenosine modification protein YeaZ
LKQLPNPNGAFRMKILALEFSSPRRSIGIGDGTSTICRSLGPEEGRTGVLECVERMLSEMGLEREQIDCIAIGLGPGSYTGIRSAIALAQGWQLARKVRVQGISSVECLAEEAHRCGMFGVLGTVVDAQRREFYLASYSVAPVGYHEKEPLLLASLKQVQARAEAGDIIVGPEVTKWFPTGHVLFPGASVLLALAAARHLFTPAEQLEPIYLRETSFAKAPAPRILPI